MSQHSRTRTQTERILGALAPHQASAHRLLRQHDGRQHDGAGVMARTLEAHAQRLDEQTRALRAAIEAPRAGCGCGCGGGCNESRRAPAVATPVATAAGGFPAQVALTPESLGNVQRAPNGTRFYCMVSPVGEAHCAASQGGPPIEPQAQSQILGQTLDPLAPDHRGTGHQQVAKAAHIPFDEASARVGYVDGEGFGFSLSKESDCERDYAFESAFNEKLGDRVLPPAISTQLQAQVESAFPPCDLDGQPRTQPS